MRAESSPPNHNLRDRVLTLVGSTYDVPVRELLRSTRGSPKAATARQVAIYLSHTVLAMPLADLGGAFGRTRSTALHAVQKVETMREDPIIDRALGWLESILRTAMEAGQ